MDHRDCSLPPPSMAEPEETLKHITNELNAALSEAGRAPGSVSITAVSKKHDTAIIRKALDAGHRIFGENRVQEAAAKWPSLREEYTDIELRLIGPLQSNKAADAAALFDVIETIDREKIAKAIASEINRQHRDLRCYVQINTGEEAQKSGIKPVETDDFIAFCQNEIGLKIEGLMCIPPAQEDPAPHFALLEKLAMRNNLSKLSMGMSADYKIAAQLGANFVRIGTGIFGQRNG